MRKYRHGKRNPMEYEIFRQKSQISDRLYAVAPPPPAPPPAAA